MKYKFVLFVLFLILSVYIFSKSVFAEELNKPTQIIKIGLFSINYERTLDNTNSLDIAYSKLYNILYSESLTNIQFNYRKYRAENAPLGFYYGPLYRISYVTSYGDPIDGGSSSYNHLRMGLGGLAGYQGSIIGDITYDINAGLRIVMDLDNIGDFWIPPNVSILFGYTW